MFLQWVKLFYRRYSVTLCGATLYLIIIGYPTVVNWTNPAPPENQLHWITGKIILAQENHPNMRVEMPDGSTRDLDFYVNLTGIFRGLPRFYSETNEELTRLQGCRAEIGVDSIRWLILPHNQRIWEVRCENLQLPYAKLIKKYQVKRKLSIWLDIGANVICILFMITIPIIGERSKKCAPNSTDSQ